MMQKFDLDTDGLTGISPLLTSPKRGATCANRPGSSAVKFMPGSCPSAALAARPMLPARNSTGTSPSAPRPATRRGVRDWAGDPQRRRQPISRSWHQQRWTGTDPRGRPAAGAEHRPTPGRRARSSARRGRSLVLAQQSLGDRAIPAAVPTVCVVGLTARDSLFPVETGCLAHGLFDGLRTPTQFAFCLAVIQR